jgi:hypothetical protein
MDAKMNIPRNFHNRSPQSIRRGPPPLEDDDEEDEEVVDEEFDALNDSIIIIYLFAKHQYSLPPVHSDFISQKSIDQTLLLFTYVMMYKIPSQREQRLASLNSGRR